MDFKKDYYKLLGVGKDASKEEVRASYRKLAKQYHPDKNQGNTEAEDRFKEINEAHEVLSNDILRHEYDQYQNAKQEWDEKHEEQRNGHSVAASNKRTYLKKRTVITETRVYVKGEVTIKYWAEPNEEKLDEWFGEIKYKIQPQDVRVKIKETNIFPLQRVPSDYLKAFKESDLFKTGISQPVKCAIQTPDEEEYYNLELKDIRIKDIRLEDVIKYEKQSLGTLKGEVYAYTPKFDYHEEEEEVTECFGETGKVETKQEGNASFYRKEYYHPDCTTYWGEWQVIRKSVQRNYRKREPVFAEANGCLQWWWAPVLFVFILAVPQFFVSVLVISLFVFLIYLATVLFSSFGRALPVLGLLLFGLFIVSAIRSFSKGQSSPIRHDTASYDSLSTTTEPFVKRDLSGDSTKSLSDTLINHFIRWKDYDSTLYEANLSIAYSDFRSSVREHNSMDPFLTANGFASVYNSMLQGDEGKLLYVYRAFDSIKTANLLDKVHFARMMVSCVQSMPYYLVVERSCADEYADAFTREYLAMCNRDCCIGYERFGVRTPVEFLSDLKGDCDTRSLFIYEILKHYGYNVALLTSQYYKHALVAVNIEGIEGFAMSIHDRNYYLWETTGAGMDLGGVPTYLQDPDHWEITLLNENPRYDFNL